MSRRSLSIALGLALVASVVGLVAFVHATPLAAASAPPDAASSTPVLVELFTSEGCSSCPPADAVAMRLAQTQPVPSAKVVVLAHHVDYWNDLGWRDPFSSPTATARQRAYAPLGGGSYTPQAVVDGRAQMVGSRGSALEEAITASARRPHARIDLDVVASPSARGVFDVRINVGALPESSTIGADLLVAVVQDRGRVTVPRGENGGRTLAHVAIARSLTTISAVATTGGSAQTVVHLPTVIGAPEGSSFSVIAFVQERASRHVLGSASAPLSSSALR